MPTPKTEIIEQPAANPNAQPSITNIFNNLLRYDIAIILLVLAVLIKALIGPTLNKLKDYIEEPAYNNNDINTLLNQLLAYSNADRVALCFFHNSDKFANGKHFWKVTMTHEACQAGVARLSRTFRNVPISHISDLITKIKDSETQVLIEPNAKYEGPFSEYLADAGAEAATAFMIENKDNVDVGILFFHYIRSTPSNHALKEAMSDPKVFKTVAQVRSEVTQAKANNVASFLFTEALKILRI